jgi:hypothetical protein
MMRRDQRARYGDCARTERLGNDCSINACQGRAYHARASDAAPPSSLRPSHAFLSWLRPESWRDLEDPEGSRSIQ